MAYGYQGQRPPLPDRFLQGQITVPRSQVPRALAEELKDAAIPAQFVSYPRLIGVYNDHAADTVAADTSEHTMKSFKFNPGTIYSTAGGFKFRAGGDCSGTGGVKTITVKFGGITIGTLSVSTGTRSWLLEGEVWNNGYTYQQRWRLIAYDGASPAIESMNVSDDTSLSVEML